MNKYIYRTFLLGRMPAPRFPVTLFDIVVLFFNAVAPFFNAVTPFFNVEALLFDEDFTALEFCSLALATGCTSVFLNFTV